MGNFDLGLDKTSAYYTEALQKAGVFDKIPYYSDLMTFDHPPHPDSHYGEPVVRDVIIDGKTCDIYHSDQKGGSAARVYVHIKGDAHHTEVEV